MFRFSLPILLLLAAPLSAHELWIEPRDWSVSTDGNLSANLVNGQQFTGTFLPFFPDRNARFDVYLGGDRTPVSGRLGDRPALSMPALGDGLHVAVYQSTISTVEYEDWAKFVSFAEHKDLGDVTAIRDANGLPEAGFKEAYTRYSKSLIAVGGGAGADITVGLETELVALANPYTDDVSGGLPVRLLYQGQVRGDAQVELFARAPDGTVSITLHRTDSAGVATLPVRPGYDYMADAVVLRLPGAALARRTGSVWETLWANLTFSVPQ